MTRFQKQPLCVAASLATLVAFAPSALADHGNQNHTPAFQVTNLVSDVPGAAQVTDPNLGNPWGISLLDGAVWLADNHSGLATAYAPGRHDGRIEPVGGGISIPPPVGSPAGFVASPTGEVVNDSRTPFTIASGGRKGGSILIFATEDGTISGWNPGVRRTSAILAVDNSASGAVYKGLALGHNAKGDFLYATNFHAGTVDVFDKNFHAAALPGSFADSTLPAGYAPFGIQNVFGRLIITYALQDSDAHDDQAGPGHGYIDVFDTDGRFIQRLASAGTLNSPWGMAVAPDDFGKFGGALLVGDFGDGAINAFNLRNGAFLGQLSDAQHNPIAIEGLWGLLPVKLDGRGNGNALLFTSGPDDENHGLFGAIQMTR